MPELPEVETVRRQIEGPLLGRRFVAAQVYWPRTTGGADAHAFGEVLKGRRILGVRRRAKYLILDWGHRVPDVCVVVHLRMTGRLHVASSPAPERYTRCAIELDEGVLRFDDVRKFGRFSLAERPDAVLPALGPEPLDAQAFSVAYLREALGQTRRAIKSVLLDQRKLAGLGNIYADESLFRAGIAPLRPANTLKSAELRRLHRVIPELLAEAIAAEGSSFDAFYRTPEGKPGAFQDTFAVYGRTGKPCRHCGRAIARIVVGQRSTHYCAHCQR